MAAWSADSSRPRGAFSRFLAADGFFLSAGLSFFFLICIIPLSLLGASTLGFVLSTEQAAREVVGQLAKQFPVYQTQIGRVLLRIVETRKISGLLGTAVLVVFSTPLFSASRLVLHRLLGVRAGGSFVRNLLRDAAMVLLLGVLLLVASTATWVFEWAQWAAALVLPIPREWLRAGSIAASLAISTVMFFLAYRYVPLRRVRVGPALAGAVLASGLWEIAKQLFRLYIREVGVYDQIYGPLGVLVAFVMFVYYTAVVFVFAGAFVAALDARR
jgi:membrane protein